MAQLATGSLTCVMAQLAAGQSMSAMWPAQLAQVEELYVYLVPSC